MKKIVLSILTFTALTFGANAQWTQVGADIDGEAAADMSASAVCLSNDGSIMAIGAKENDGGGAQSGHVRVYQNISGSWSQIGADINGEASADYSAFNPNSVSLSGDGSIVAIGAPGNDGPGGVGNYGHVRVYQNVSGTWTQIGADIDGEASADGSGIAVSLSDDGSIVAIGAKDNDGAGSNHGHVRVYQNVSGTWTQVGTDIDGEAAGDYSGGAVSLSDDGTIVAIGAAGNDGGGSNLGHVRVYQNISGTWTQVGADIDGEANGDESGSAVSLSNDGNIVAIAARNNDGGGAQSGHVRVYQNVSGTWTKIGADIDGELSADYSGYSISMNGDGMTVAIGAAGNNGPGGTTNLNYGHVRVYQNVSGTWTKIGSDIDGEATSDQSGFSVALDNSGNTVAIGAINNDGNGTDAGHVRVYSNVAAPCTVNIPDANFKFYLIGNSLINTNGNGEIECTEAIAFTGSINCSNSGIADLTGVEAFTNLSSLDFQTNTVSTVDLSANTALQTLICYKNSLTNLDLSSNSSLVYLNCFDNQLSSLNVANGNNTNVTDFYTITNPNLTCITVDDVAYSTTNWTNIDAQTSFSTNCNACYVNVPDANFKAYLLGNTLINTNGNAEIECAEATAFTGTINCSNSSIADLTGIEAFTSLQNLDFQTNSVTTVDLSANVALQTLICYSNSLTGLDLSNNSALVYLNAHTNALTSLNIANGNNTNHSYFLTTVNPNLTCITVDDVAYSTANWSSGVDAGVGFSINCNGCFVNIPDANFKTYLLGNTAINTNGNTEIECTEATAFTGAINCTGLNISDLTGIEAFTAIHYLYCVSNQLTTLDLTNNTDLQVVYCFSNSLTSLITPANNTLTVLYCENNSITDLDLSNNTGLTALKCGNNSLTSLNVANGNNTNVTLFNTYNNPNLTCISVDDANYSTSNWTDVDWTTSFSINCNGCFVNIPDANFKTNLLGNTAINTNGNTEIECAEATAFTGAISCANLNITDLTGIEAFTGLTQLFCGGNSLTSLDVTQNIALTDLYCQINTITSLDVTQNTALSMLACHFNYLTSLDLTQNTLLNEVECRENAITSLDVSLNTALTVLYCQDNSLTSLNVANGNNTNFTKLKTINNPNLTCIQVDDVAYSTTNWVGSSYAYTGMPFSTNCGTVNINELKSTTMTISPNPAKDVLSITSTEAIEQVSIYNVNGALISVISENTNSVNVSELVNGMYILVVKTNNGISHSRFVKE